MILQAIFQLVLGQIQGAAIKEAWKNPHDGAILRGNFTGKYCREIEVGAGHRACPNPTGASQDRHNGGGSKSSVCPAARCKVLEKARGMILDLARA
jgi:hypothetical protein